MEDLQDVRGVSIDITRDEDGNKLWVNVNGSCALRIHRFEYLTIKDTRKWYRPSKRKKPTVTIDYPVYVEGKDERDKVTPE